MTLRYLRWRLAGLPEYVRSCWQAFADGYRSTR